MAVWPRIVATAILALAAAPRAEGQVRLPAEGAGSPGPASIATNPPGSARLVYRFEEGQTARQEVRLDGFLWLPNPSGPAGAPESVPMALTGGYSLVRQVRTAGSGGGGVVDLTPTAVALDFDALGGLVSVQVRDAGVLVSAVGHPVPLETPSAVPDGPGPVAITATIAADGRIIEARAGAEAAPGGDQASALFAVELAVQTAPALPSRSVSEGDSWTAVWQLALGGAEQQGAPPALTLVIESRSTLVALLDLDNRRSAVIDSITRMRLAPPDGTPGEPAERSGSFRTEFDVDRGEVIRSEGTIVPDAVPGNPPSVTAEEATGDPGSRPSETLFVTVETVGATVTAPAATLGDDDLELETELFGPGDPGGPGSVGGAY